ncbi:type II toxin-antitoxin system PemK/MazF family toxin [Pseudarthrobacter sp. NamE2]|uniref:type II toxin-antitoxin system PemK/MazF family toxin n=1 Tax=Pseudarthrobacter sp. NamE2 TaxID=2576838 RepID=UPI0010FF51E1|nr:type II toxin-antitoxin system PemK/MazF family toxin [Pseudarthrobacter sp. NamE2]TLM86386.1 type II toxin-antitoxin system PemK/MazF family toxin [Pseudarthrobacter sp. NamE2]
MAFKLLDLRRAVRTGLRLLRAGGSTGAGNGMTAGTAPRGSAGAGSGTGTYPGDFHGRSSVRYAPNPDGAPDPGEVVWAWVPYEEDYSLGKDRPVLLVGRSGPYLLGLMLTSRDRVPAGPAAGDYVDVGAGGWDRQSRPSEARLDRILQIRPGEIRREGAVLERGRFEAVAAGLRRRHGWT